MSIDAERDMLESMLPPTDKFTDELYADIRLAEDLLNADDGIASVEEAFGYVNEIDRRWQFMNCTLKLTGAVYYPRIEESIDTESDVVDNGNYSYLDPLSRRVVDQEFYTSRGFYPRKQMIEFGPETGKERWRIMHLLETTQEVIRSDNAVATYLMKCTAMVDEVSVEYPFETLELGISRCAYDFPEVTEELECLLLNSENRDEALLSLRKLVIPRSDEFDFRSYERIQFYINRILDLDARAPSRITLSADSIISILDESGEFVPMRQNKKQKILAADMEVVLMKNFKYNKKTEELEPVEDSYIPAIRCTELRSNQDFDCTNVWIPIRYVRKCTNLRDAFFRKADHSDALYEFAE